MAADPIAAIVAERLVALGWSNGELARRSGVAQPTISRWLSGTRTLNSELVARVLDAAGLAVKLAGRR
jgi:transcriptional regulator with XRE-family HTH domain